MWLDILLVIHIFRDKGVNYCSDLVNRFTLYSNRHWPVKRQSNANSATRARWQQQKCRKRVLRENNQQLQLVANLEIDNKWQNRGKKSRLHRSRCSSHWFQFYFFVVLLSELPSASLGDRRAPSLSVRLLSNFYSRVSFRLQLDLSFLSLLFYLFFIRVRFLY